MRGITVCPHCDTRFRITQEQLETHHSMVRCGHCMEAFDTRPNFSPDQLDLQLELPVLCEPVTPPPSQLVVLQPMTLAEQVAIVHDEGGGEFQTRRRTWPWTIAASLLLFALLAQAAYFFRVDLAARIPNLKPALLSYCQLLICSVPLPQHTELVGIESSELVTEPGNENQITLNALLRSRASYAQAFPHLELTLNDSQDQALVRRAFRPADYLPPPENETTGLLPNYEINIKLHLATTGIKPAGYQLVLFYPGN